MQRPFSLLIRLGLSALSISLLPWAIQPSLAQANLELFGPEASSTEIPTSNTVLAFQQKDESVDAFIEEMIRENQIPGLSVAVIYDEKLIKTKGYGLLDREREIKVRPSSIFPIASVSKPLTATAVMLLVESGQLDLDAPISTYLSDLPETWQTITLRQMLAHTAGLSEKVYMQRPSRLTTSVSFLAEAIQEPLDFQPDEAWMYSNTGYNLAATIVETVSGQSFGAFMQARIFEPLGMTHTDVLRASYVSSNLAIGYEPTARNQKLEAIDVNYAALHRVMPMFQGAGSITSNALDMANWAIALQKGQLLTPESQAQMQQFNTLSSGRVTDYGLGWFLKTVNGHDMIFHGGNLWGYASSIVRFPEDSLSVIVLMNKDGALADSIAQQIARQYLPDLVEDKEAAAIPDLDPALTEQILAFVNGDDQAIATTPERLIALQTLRGQSMLNRFRQYTRAHTIESLSLLERADHPNGIRQRYRAQTAAGDIHSITVVVTDEGLLSSIGILS
ncbi:serine hydrolase [cf. Phormidesmis sp. LEGE 11477]|uniref:serine hydrolase domain-containing protein n=1 Tax=cf. Phormidesmis sp. LEGE 11477 TaxID=1828680 RepID=UPI00187E8001|nr:serine hydrolase domain-containing protein [cf. Phormidesmis sp. LEGE 11477]MBE9061521.1 beta-lactamase family protein [cf. Phormidesmis sp. LEGE 11477]